MTNDASAPGQDQAGVRQVASGTLRLLRPFWLLALCGSAIGITSGLATAALLATINAALQSAEIGSSLLIGLVGFGLLGVGGAAASGTINSVVGQRLIASLRKDISAGILRAPIPALEAYGPHRLLAILTNDVDMVSVFTFNVSGYAIALATTLGGFAFLLVLSPVAFAFAVVSLALGLTVSLIAKRDWIRDYRTVREAQDDLHAQYRAIVEGAKELRISRPRRARVFGVALSGAADRIAAAKSRAMTLYWLADAAGAGFFFLAIGLLLVLRDRLGIEPATISGVAIVLLYVKGPAAQVAGALPAFDQARIAFGRIAALSSELDGLGGHVPLDQDVPGAARSIRTLELRGVAYTYPDRDGRERFTLGPIDLTLKPGEVTFVVGANGAGKTTLVKLLLGLYEPSAGEVLVDGRRIEAADRDAYRQLFSPVFSDYHLFEELPDPASAPEARAHLGRLGLADKVRIEGGRFSTTDLSTGQRKRLALLHAYLEERPVVVTDEWAADQDPEFRRRFYEDILPALRAQGRMIVVISHDDRYFGSADRVIRLRDGAISSIGELTPDRVLQR